MYSLSLSLSKSVCFRANENRLERTRDGAVESAVRVWFFGAALVEIFHFFFPCLRRENSPLFALREREICCAMSMSVFYLMRCEDTNGRMRLFLYRCERILCGYYGRFRRCGGVLRTPTTRRRTRDFGPKEKRPFWDCVCANVFCNKKLNKKQNTNLLSLSSFPKNNRTLTCKHGSHAQQRKRDVQIVHPFQTIGAALVQNLPG